MPSIVQVKVTKVRIWNETVSNLTLMALGSSAPEILLAIIEIFGNNFEAGELGPGTIVGSAAFNLFVIIGICVFVIPDGKPSKSCFYTIHRVHPSVRGLSKIATQGPSVRTRPCVCIRLLLLPRFLDLYKSVCPSVGKSVTDMSKATFLVFNITIY